MTQPNKIIVEPRVPLPEARSTLASWYTPGFSDGFGDRLLMFDNTTAASLEMLRFKPEFGNNRDFEDALRQRLKRFERFNHPSVAAARSVDWLDAGEGLALVSNHVAGRRLSEIIEDVHGPAFAMELLRQLTPVLAILQEHGRGLAHGALTAERVVVTPRGRLVIVEHVLGSALESLHLSAGRLQSEFGIVLAPERDGCVRDARTDVVQLALLALSVLIGRSIEPAMYPEKISKLLDEFSQSIDGRSSAVPRLRGWLEHALQLDGRTFATARDAHARFNDLQEDHELDQAGHPRHLQAINGGAGPSVPSTNILPPASEDPWPDVSLTKGDAHDADTRIDTQGRGQARLADQRRAAWFPTADPRVENEPEDPEVSRPAHGAMAMPQPQGRVRAARLAIAALVVLVIAEGLVIGWSKYSPRRVESTAGSPAAPLVATRQAASVQTSLPSEPATAAVPPGSEPDLTMRDGPAAATVAPAATSHLEVVSDPPGASVTVDGQPRGTAPVAISVAPGPHVVVVSDGKTTTTRTMTTVAGGTATLTASLAPAGAAGWLTISAPLELQVREGGSVLGTTSVDRLMLPAGPHTLEVNSYALGFQKVLSVTIQPGKTTQTSVTVPDGALSINALPWANVSLDGQALAGTTPFANLTVPIGTHEILYRHPQLGERRQTVVVTAKAPIRTVMDFSK